MKTDDLINMLASGLDVAAPKMPLRRFAAWLLLGMLVSIALMASLLGVRPNLDEMALLPAFWLKIAFVLMLAVAGALTAARLSRPGARTALLPAVIAAPVLMIWIAAAFALTSAAPEERAHLFWGDTWRYCPWLIALLSLPLFVAIVNIMRTLAPTRLRLAGAGAGFAAGAGATLVYSIHCPEIAAPFIGFWYLLGVAVPTCIGAIAGPRVLRW
jgi:hypothetical protein